MNEKLIMEKKAHAFRKKLGLKSSDPFNCDYWLRDMNVVTLFDESSRSLSGMAIKVAEGRLMFVNCALPLGKQHFTIVHELYHLFEQENFTFAMCNAEQFVKKDKEEYNADYFGSYVLLPTEGLLSQIPEAEMKKDSIQLTTIINIEHRFQCSRTALTIRLKELGMVTEPYRLGFLTDIAKNVKDAGQPTELYFGTKPKFIGENYQRILDAVYEKGLLKDSDYQAQLEDIRI